MSDDEDPGYLPIEPGMRVFIEYEDPELTESHGGLGTVVKVVNAWTARIDRGNGVVRLYPRWLLRLPD